MYLIHRSVMDAAAALFGWRRAYTDITEIDGLLTEQAQSAYTAAAGQPALAAVKNVDALHVQPGVLDVRGRVLADVFYLEGVLTGARTRSLPQELIERLEAVVDTGHRMTALLADTARTTTAVHTAGH